MNSADFTFACEAAGDSADPWSELRVVRVHGKEAISSLYHYEIILFAPADRPDVKDLIGKRCSLRIATESTPAFKVVHGVVVEAEEIAALPEGRTLKVLLMPPWVRATHRRRCRIFLEKTLRQILESVLTGDPLVHKEGASPPDPDDGGTDFEPAMEGFTFRVADASRLDNKRVRTFVVQYNESDFAFMSRLLEEEGIAYHIENGRGATLLVLSDSDAGRPRLEPDTVAAGSIGRDVRSFFAGARLRPQAVMLGDYNWKQPGVEMTARTGDQGADLFEHHYPGGYPDEASQGRPLASAVLGRHQTEARFAHGEGRLRVLSAGTIFELEHKKARLAGEYLVTSLEIRGEQGGVLKSDMQTHTGEPFLARFECARRGENGGVKESQFRPARVTPIPRIAGSQTAVVTAEPSSSGAEIRVGGPDGIDIGCVRLRFHWDTEHARLDKEPSSAWVRVSEPFAGSGMGGVWHPRVGTEVIVEFEGGDPDRPIVIGRVYNGVNQPHRGGAPTVSTLKSNASPGGAVYNEITYDDTAGAELIYTKAGKDMETDVGNIRTEAVGADASMKVGANDKEDIGTNCTVVVGANDTVTVGANETNIIAGNNVTKIGANSLTIVGGNETHAIGANQSIMIGATHTEMIGGVVTEHIGGTLTTTVAASETETIGASRSTTIAGAHAQDLGAAHVKLVGGDRSLTCAALTTEVGAAAIRIVGGNITTSVGGSHTLNAAAGAVYLAPSYTATDSNRSDTDAHKIKMTGLDVSIGALKGTATGLSSTTVGASVSVIGVKLDLVGAEIETIGLKTRIDGGHLEFNGFKGRFGLIIKL